MVTFRLHACGCNVWLAPLLALLCAGALLLKAVPVAARVAPPSLAERSVISQGAWWNPERSGSGFEIFTFGNQAAILWYTFSPEGSPVWYLAQGDLGGASGSVWPLMRHSWIQDGQGGRPGPAAEVGVLRLNVLHPEAAEVSWQIGGTSGTWPIQPLMLSGIMNETDRSGAWYSPAASGWGLSLIEQGTVLAGALYTYDAQGQPTWFSGHDASRSGLNLLRYSGACPACVHRTPTTQPAGRLDFTFESETRLSLTAQLAVATAAGTQRSGAQLVQLSRPASSRTADRQLARFTTDAEFRRHVEAGMLKLFPPVLHPQAAGMSFSPAPAASSVVVTASGTNLQEVGVDEADLVKTVADQVWTFAHHSNGQRIGVLRRARVTEDGATLTVLGEHRLMASDANVLRAGMVVTDNRLATITSNAPSAPFGSLITFCTPYIWRNGVTDIEILDTTPSPLPRRLWHARLNGFLVASRRIGDNLYVVTRHVPEVSGFNYANSSDAVRAANRAVLAAQPLSTFLPSALVNGLSAPLLRADQIYAPPQGARGLSADLFTVTVVSLAQPGIRDALGIMGTLDTVYMSPAALYLVSARHTPAALALQFGLPEPAGYLSDVHQVRLEGSRLTLGGSGTVEGFVDARGENAPFRLSEQAGRLRIVTSSTRLWGDNSNRVTVLELSPTRPGLLRTVSYLPNAQRSTPLGKPREMLYGTRFDGSRLYAVTFLKTDPLYVVDLSRPEDPAITGELQVTGYSDYLHPLGNGLLLGVGLDARPAQSSGDGQFAWFQGLQITLFDVSDDRQPRELQKLLIGKRGSTSPLLTDHHAFSSLRMGDGTLSMGIPAAVHESVPGRPQASDSEWQPWSHTGLLRLRLRGSTPADARLEQQETLVTHKPPAQAYTSAGRAANARSVLFPSGTLLISDGAFWLMRKDGSVSVSP